MFEPFMVLKNLSKFFSQQILPKIFVTKNFMYLPGNIQDPIKKYIFISYKMVNSFFLFFFF